MCSHTEFKNYFYLCLEDENIHKLKSGILEYLIGIDIGGTSVKLGLVSQTGAILRHVVFPTQPLTSVPHFFQTLSTQIQQLLREQQLNADQILGIGVGAPGHSTTDGMIIGAVNLPFRDEIPIVEFLGNQFGLPTFLLKDAKVAALGEKFWGTAKKMNDFVLLMLGTGLGYAAYSDGRIINGHQGLSSELGHAIFEIDGRKCNCGKKGCLETYLSATGLKRTAFEILQSDNRKSALHKYTFQELTTKIIAELAMEGDELAREAFDRTGKYLGIQMANLTEQLTPEGFIISGGLAEAGSLLLAPAKETFEANLQPIYRNKVQVLTSSLPASEVGVLGAAALVLDKLEKTTEIQQLNDHTIK